MSIGDYIIIIEFFLFLSLIIFASFEVIFNKVFVQFFRIFKVVYSGIIIIGVLIPIIFAIYKASVHLVQWVN